MSGERERGIPVEQRSMNERATKGDGAGRPSPRPRRIGVATIGQTPRPDLLQPFLQAAEARAQANTNWVQPEFVEAGALDGLSRERIKALQPAPQQPFYVTKLADGKTIQLAADKLERELQRVVNDQLSDTDLTVIACTGSFPTLHSSEHPGAPLVIEPDRLLKRTIAGIDPRRLAIVVPEEAQRAALAEGWHGVTGAQPMSAVLSPYVSEGEADVAGQLAATLNELASPKPHRDKPDLIVFDCMAYDETLLSPMASRLTSIPVLFSAATVARIVVSMV